jgi:hypothetical protein
MKLFALHFYIISNRRVRISGVFGVCVELAEGVGYGHVQEQTLTFNNFAALW